MNQFVALAAGGGISGIVGVLVAFAQQRLSRRTLNQTARRQLLGELVAASSAGNMRISNLAQAPVEKKDEVRASEAYRLAVDNFNTAVAQVELTEDSVLVVAAVKLDKAMTTLARKAASEEFPRDIWLEERKPVHQAIREFLATARKELGSPQLPESESDSMFQT